MLAGWHVRDLDTQQRHCIWLETNFMNSTRRSKQEPRPDACKIITIFQQRREILQYVPSSLALRYTRITVISIRSSTGFISAWILQERRNALQILTWVTKPFKMLPACAFVAKIWRAYPYEDPLENGAME